MKVWIASVLTIVLLGAGVLVGACGDGDDANDGDSEPDPVLTTDHQEGDDIDENATPDPVDPSVVSTVGIDALPDTSEIDGSADVSAEFMVAFTVTELGLPMVGYQFDLEWDNEDIEFVNIDHLETGGLTLCPPTVQLDPQRILGACAQPQLQPVDSTGQLAYITLRCAAPGETTLRLRYQEGSFGTKIETVEGNDQTSHSLVISDATVVCS
jgi:hypothetical protein